MDIAPRYAGFVMGLSNTAGTLSGAIGLWVTGELLDWGGGPGYRQGWFAAYIVAAICAGGASVVF